MAGSQALYWRLRPWLTPGLENSHIIYAKALQPLADAAHTWLDLGCGRYFVPEWAPFNRPRHPAQQIVGVDLDAEALREHPALSAGAIADGEALPFLNETFDLVTASMVLEHVASPDRVFAEVFRVLKPGGRFLCHTPNVAGYTTVLTRLAPPSWRVGLAGLLQDRAPRDVYPTFYRANTRGALRRFAARAGFGLIAITPIDSSPLFASFAPLVVPELVFIRLLRVFHLDGLRPCLLATFEKPPAPRAAAGP